MQLSLKISQLTHFIPTRTNHFLHFKPNASDTKNGDKKEREAIHMNNWTNEIINRLDTAYNARFEKEKSLVFLNDAYQNLLFLKLKYTIDEDTELSNFATSFMEVRDLFINELSDRYPEIYAQVACQIQKLHDLNGHLSTNI